ncbi:MAG: thioredoxin fold domain-containing protein [Bacteroidota bacterium]
MRIWFLLCLLFACLHADGQMRYRAPGTPVDSLPYMKYPVLPAFNILLTDSSTIVNTYNIPKGRPVVLMLFDPDCQHCRELTKMLTDSMESLKHIRFYMFTSAHSMEAIKKFKEDFSLDKYSNVEAIGRDYEFFFISYYGVRHVPDFALYDENRKLVKLFENFVTPDLLRQFTGKPLTPRPPQH